MDKLNTKKLDILKPDEEWEGLTIEIKPRSDVIGKVYRQWASRIAVILENRPPEVIKGEIEKGEYKLGIDGQMIRILPTMVNFIKKEPENFISIEGVFGSMYIDTESTPELLAEGFAREVVRRVQEMRKEVDMDVEDYLKTQIKAKGDVLDMLAKWRDFIAFETRSRSLDFNEEEINEEYMVEWQIEKETIGIGITPLYIKEAIDSYTKIPGMTPKKAIALYDADYKTLHQLDKTTKNDLMKVKGISEADARHIREYFDRPEDQRIKKVTFCPFCGVEIPPRATKCPRCDELVREDIKICKNCAREVPMKTERCYYCGAHPDEEKVVAPKVEPEKAAASDDVAALEAELEAATPVETKAAAKATELPELFDSSIPPSTCSRRRRQRTPTSSSSGTSRRARRDSAPRGFTRARSRATTSSRRCR
jgi:hypothetical protein